MLYTNKLIRVREDCRCTIMPLSQSRKLLNLFILQEDLTLLGIINACPYLPLNRFLKQQQFPQVLKKRAVLFNYVVLNFGLCCTPSVSFIHSELQALFCP